MAPPSEAASNEEEYEEEEAAASCMPSLGASRARFAAGCSLPSRDTMWRWWKAAHCYM